LVSFLTGIINKYRKMKLTILATLATYAAAFTGPISKPTFTASPSALNLYKTKKLPFKAKVVYVPALALKDLPEPGFATSCVAGGLAICIAVDKSGKIYALGDKCPPVNQPLSFGKVGDGFIEDPVLGTKFLLNSGEVAPGGWCPSGIGKLLGALFDPVGVPTYSVKKTKNAIEVQVDVNYKFNYESQYWSGVLDAQGKSDGKYY